MKRIVKILPLLLIFVILLSSCGGVFGEEATPTIDVNAFTTSIAQTALAQLTQDAQSWTATPSETPSPTITETFVNTNTPVLTFETGTATVQVFVTTETPAFGFPTSPFASLTPIAGGGTGGFPTAVDTCNQSQYVADITIPDGEQMALLEDFEKIWALKNTGTCTWTKGYQLAFAGGDFLSGFPDIISGESQYVKPEDVAEMKVKMTAPNKKGEFIGNWKMQTDKGFFFGTYVSVVIKVK